MSEKPGVITYGSPLAGMTKVEFAMSLSAERIYLEKVVEKYLVDRVRALGGVCWKWVSPGRNGVPDRIVILPGPKIHLVELKQRSGRLSKYQIRVWDILEGLGIKRVILDSKNQIDDFIKEISDG